jgi:GT2 family glycosyltransferase
MISAVVPTYRGAARLARHLPSVLGALSRSGDAFELIVVDDGGGGVGELPSEARLLALPKNRGYGSAVGAGAREARGERLLILNDDVELEPDTVAVLARHLVPPVFAVVPRIASTLAACGDEGGKTAVFAAGMLEVIEAPAEAPHPTLYPVGCCMLCVRADFLELGGYAEEYAPFFWEDVELGYRAWRRGLRVVHVPAATCTHEGSATLRETHDAGERERVFFRNRVLFHLRNLQDPARRRACLGALAAMALFDDRPARQRGLAEALERFSAVGPVSRAGLSDDEILASVRSGGGPAAGTPAP